MLKKIIIYTFAMLTISLTGCGYVMVDRVLQYSEQMVKLKMEHENRLRKEIYNIEGTINSVELINVKKQITDINDKIDDQKKISSIKIDFNEEKAKTYVNFKVWNILFSDGVAMEFVKIPAKPFKIGTKYKITYNGLLEIISTKEIKND